ncbi:hypothetical protein D3C72_2084380 [compost metagenome]
MRISPLLPRPSGKVARTRVQASSVIRSTILSNAQPRNPDATAAVASAGPVAASLVACKPAQKAE